MFDNDAVMYGELVNLKTRGGLTHPLEDSYKICRTAEQELRGVSTTDSKFYQKLTLKSLRNIGPVYKNGCSSEHIHSMTKLMVKLYLTVRLHHLAKLRNFEITKKMVRHKNTKSTHQHHQ